MGTPKRPDKLLCRKRGQTAITSTIDTAIAAAMPGSASISEADDVTEQPKRLIPPERWSDYYPWPPIGGLRHIIFHSKTNGFDKAIYRFGKCVLIDDVAFFKIVTKRR